MIKELINFTETLDKDIKLRADSISEGLHIFLDMNNVNELFIKDYLIFLNSEVVYGEANVGRATFYEKYSSYISMNQQQKFDKLQKIHSSSPYSFAFNFSLGNSKKEIENKLKKDIYEKKTITDDLKIESQKYKTKEVIQRAGDYFINAQKLCIKNSINNKTEELIRAFQEFCERKLEPFIFGLVYIGKTKKGNLEERNLLTDLNEKSYVRIYLSNVDDQQWIEAYNNYYNNEYPPGDYNESDFLTTYNVDKVFNIHQTASFDKNIQLKGIDSKILKDFKRLAKIKQPKALPNPLPIFIYKEEIQNELMQLFKEDGTLSYKDLIIKLWSNHKHEISNYYLIYWYYTKDLNIVDFDFVSKFEYEVELQILNLFELKEKDSKGFKFYPKIKNLFELETNVFKELLQNKSFRLDYFKELDPEDFKDRKFIPNKVSDNTFISFCKYRKAVYDYVYKSQRQTIDGKMFDEMVFNGIRDDIKQNNDYGVKTKLNIWYSLYEHFNSKSKNIKTMASELKSYQKFVEDLTSDTADLANSTDKQFAFTAGQVIYYILEKSKSGDNSYQLLEPYLQQSKCSEFKKAIANDFARYKHENFSKNYERAASFVLSYQTEENMKHLMPEILSGVFAKNQLFSNKSN